MKSKRIQRVDDEICRLPHRAAYDLRNPATKAFGYGHLCNLALVFFFTCFLGALAHADIHKSVFDGDNSFSPDDDPSYFGELKIGDLPQGLLEANEGSFEGGETGTAGDAEANNVLQPEQQRDDGVFNIPTNSPP